MTIVSATPRIKVSFNVHWNVFHEFHPIGGVAASAPDGPAPSAPEPSAAASPPVLPFDPPLSAEPLLPLDPAPLLDPLLLDALGEPLEDAPVDPLDALPDDPLDGTADPLEDPLDDPLEAPEEPPDPVDDEGEPAVVPSSAPAPASSPMPRTDADEEHAAHSTKAAQTHRPAGRNPPRKRPTNEHASCIIYSPHARYPRFDPGLRLLPGRFCLRPAKLRLARNGTVAGAVVRYSNSCSSVSARSSSASPPLTSSSTPKWRKLIPAA